MLSRLAPNADPPSTRGKGRSRSGVQHLLRRLSSDPSPATPGNPPVALSVPSCSITTGRPLSARQAKIAQAMYDEPGADGRRAHTVQQIADEFGVTRPTIYRHLQRQTR
jgi:hypothetical protein